VIIEYLEDGLHGLFVDRVDVFPPSFLNEYEAAPNQRLKIMRNHALVLVQSLRDFRHVSRAILQKLKNS
jgi:hypothetical protein